MRVILNMEFYSSAEMKISLAPEQTEWLSSYDDIRTIIKDNPDTVMAFDIYDSGDLIGFFLVHRFGKRKFFIWEYAIDIDHQDQHKGFKALTEFIDHMKINHNAQEITTTYIYGNERAKHLYEKAGFVETDVVDTPECHEVNMVYYVPEETIG